MAWYSNIFGGNKAQEADMEKLNPIQQYFGNDKEGSREYTQNYEQFYETLEIVNRGVNMIVDDVAEIPVVVQPNQTNGVQKGIRRSTVNKLLNKEPNLFQDVSSFKRNLITDYLLDGNIFIYYDGAHLYHLLQTA